MWLCETGYRQHSILVSGADVHIQPCWQVISHCFAGMATATLLMQQKDRKKEAMSYFEKALAKHVKAFGSDHAFSKDLEALVNRLKVDKRS